ncbi:MAG: 2-oxo acid dehydrogenase subunit E2 [Verrucomicrobiales bacterium]|nr:2-oxo acid dehydrogenase subunit E2 [Verrucomicrobiales bacterium]MCP5526829.1 2-oxo acid dehydrogenase subunit E2 [Verrucomicrobiales bacterium]
MDIKLPNLGEGADSGVVVSLFVKPGDRVEQDQPILEIENEKAVASIPATAAGVVEAIHVKPGDKVSVGQRLLTIGGQPGPGGGAEPAPTTPAPAVNEPTSIPAAAPAPPSVEPEVALPPVSGEPPPASPSIRRLARELGIDLRRLRGSERGGRVVMGDLRAYIQRLEKLVAKASATGDQARKPRLEPVDFAKWGPITVKPLSQLRQVIARRMGESWALVPRVTQFDEADVTGLLALRKQHVQAYEERGARLTLTGFIIKALAAVLHQHPVFNASLDATEENLVFKSYVNIGIAVDTDQGLLVPVLRDADKKSLLEISRDLEDLAARARDRNLALDEMKGGTFTISNQGGIGSAHFTPIVNLPEAAILGVGRGAIKPVWQADQFVPRNLLPLTLSYDHRLIDGGSAARFMVDLVQALQDFSPSLVQL